MKQCPTCRTTYTDETLSFCLADGAVLADMDEQATFVRPAGEQMRVVIPQDAPKPHFAVPPPLSTKSGTGWMKIVLVVGLLGFMVLAAAGIAGALIYFNKDARTGATNANTSNKDPNRPTPTPTIANTTANTDTDQLRNQIANLEKRLNEQKNSDRPVSNIPPPPDQPVITSTTARVNSPGDGFLAMRSLPNSEAGTRVLQIPHGATVSLNGCLPRTRIASKTGRWCRASYGGYTGWVFDAWLVY